MCLLEHYQVAVTHNLLVYLFLHDFLPSHSQYIVQMDNTRRQPQFFDEQFAHPHEFMKCFGILRRNFFGSRNPLLSSHP